MAPLQAYGYAAGLPIFEPINGVVPLAATHLSTPQTDARGVALGNNAVCVASGAIHPYTCPFGSGCEPTRIEVGDEVPIQVCVQNEAEIPPTSTQVGVDSSDLPGFLALEAVTAEAVLVEGTKITMQLASKTSNGWDSHGGVLRYSGFDPVPGIDTSFELGASERCSDQTACGILTLNQRLSLPADEDTKICLGTIRTTAIGLPEMTKVGLATATSGSSGLIPRSRRIYVGAFSTSGALLITDSRCLAGISSALDGSTVAVFAESSPPAVASGSAASSGDASSPSGAPSASPFLASAFLASSFLPDDFVKK